MEHEDHGRSLCNRTSSQRGDGPAIVEYLERIDDTLAHFDGRFIIHGDRPEVKEGAGESDLIVIAFPDRTRADAWFNSPEYQAIKLLRSDNSQGEIFIIDGVDADHKVTDVLDSGV